MAASKKTEPRSKSTRAPKEPPATAPEKEKDSGRELLGLFLLCLGVLSGIYSFFPSSNLATDVLQGIAGKLCFLVPILLLWVGALVAFSSGRKFNPGRIALMGGLAFLLFAFVHLIDVHETYAQVSIRRYVNYCFHCYQQQCGTGFIGAALAYPLYLTVGRVGGMVVVIFLAIADLVLLRVISLQKIGTAARKIAQSGADTMRVRRDAWREERDRRQVEVERARRDTLYVEKITPVSPAQPAPAEKSAQPAEKPADAPARRRSVPRMDTPASDAQVFETVSSRPRKPRAMHEADPAVPDMQDYDVIDVFRTPDEPVASAAPALEEDMEDPFAAEPIVEDPKVEDPSCPADEPVPAPEEAPEFPEYEEPAMEAEEDPESDEDPFDTDDSPAFDDENGDLLERTTPYVAASRRNHAPRTMDPLPERSSEVRSAEVIDPASRIDGSPLVAPKEEMRIEEEVFGEYNYPPVDLLAAAKPSQVASQAQSDREKAKKLEETLHSFGISAKLVGIAHGPAVTRFELLPAPGVKVSRITALADDIALSLAALNIRIEAPIPGKSAVGVEVPNEEVEIVNLREVLESNDARKHPSRLAVALGKDNSGRYIVSDLAKMPHLLIAGATGSGKSVCINNFICSILYRAAPEEVRMIMIDPKMVELSVYNGIPHLLVPVVTDPKKAAGALAWAVAEMTQRYKLFSEKGVRDMKGYNLACGPEDKPMPQIVVIIDELADLMMVCPGEVEDSICRLAQLARAAGIHLVIATQRPSVNVITGIIKANIPSRIAFTVASQVDSRTILDVGGAEKLLGRGDMLYAPSGTTKPARVQGAWVSDKEVAAIVDYIKARHDAEYDEDLIEHMNHQDDDAEPETEAESGEVDELLAQAIEMSVESGQASISMLQRRLRVGYARAGRLIDEMAARGIVSQSEGAKPRSVLITREQYKMMFGDDT